jgi:hypothetical protein
LPSAIVLKVPVAVVVGIRIGIGVLYRGPHLVSVTRFENKREQKQIEGHPGETTATAQPAS